MRGDIESQLHQMIASKQEDRIQEQDTFNGYRWPYQVTTFTTNSSGADERHSPYSFIEFLVLQVQNDLVPIITSKKNKNIVSNADKQNLQSIFTIGKRATTPEWI